jgi:SNF2 family DNA or RNA helicase
MNIVRADAFTLDMDEKGGFSPRLLHRSHAAGADDDQLPAGAPALPEGPQQDFEKRFRQAAEARKRYTTRGSWYVVMPDQLHKALKLVKQKQSAPLAERLAFIANPQSALKEQLQDELDEKIIEALFEETPEFLSDRIEKLGEWQPKTVAYVMPNTLAWLPDDEMVLGIPVGDAIYPVSAKDVPAIKEAIEDAIQTGKPSVDYDGQKIPANEESFEAFSGLLTDRKSENDKEPQSEDLNPEVEAPERKLVPILKDNIDDLKYVAKTRPAKGEPGGLPSVLKTTPLYQHQSAGLEWLQQHWVSGSSGALLADDMGLGKTIQSLAFLGWIQEQMEFGRHPRKPMLIVAPTGLLRNWQDEAALHLNAPGLGQLFKAFGRDLSEFRDMSQHQRVDRLRRADWVLTTYETLRDKIRYFIGVDWAVIVFDEVQKIKNPASRLTEMAKSVKSDFVLALTGTPVENRLADLWSIIDAVAPGELGALKEFHTKYERGSEQNPDVLHELKTQLMEQPAPVRMKRRMKEDHLEGLPQKHEHLLRVEMPSGQASVYDEVIGAAGATAGSQGAMLKVLQDMRKVSLLPMELDAAGMTDEVVAESARLSATMRLLDDIREQGEKALVFVEFIALQDALIPYLQRRYQLPSPPLRISGSVPGQTRKAHVDRFQSRPKGQFDIMLLSPKAGGVGLTLTAANNVIHLSRWWNPAVEDQCTDRVYRIGQTQNVNVYYPLAVHPRIGDQSFDINLHGLLEQKRALSRSVLASPIASDGDLQALFQKSIGAG